LSGFRDKILEKKYKILNSVTKDCQFLIVKDSTSSSNKVQQAKKLNIPIILKSDLEEKNDFSFQK
jgi:ribosomal protein S2